MVSSKLGWSRPFIWSCLSLSFASWSRRSEQRNWLHLISSLKQIVLPCFAEATNSEPSCLQSLSLSAILPKSFASCSYHGTLWKGRGGGGGEEEERQICALANQFRLSEKFGSFAAPRAGGLITSYFRLAQVVRNEKWEDVKRLLWHFGLLFALWELMLMLN